MAGDVKGSEGDVSPITQILEQLGMSREDLTRHTEQMRSFLQTQEVKDVTPSSIGALIFNAASAYSANILSLADSEGHAYRSYGFDMDGLTVAVVRPDAMIGAVATSVGGLEEYFTRVFGIL